MLKRRLIGIAVVSLAAAFTTQPAARAAQDKIRSSSQQPTTPKAKTPQRGARLMGDTCPMQMPDVTVSVTDVPGGVAIAYVTGNDDVLSVRRLVERMAERHNRGKLKSAMPMTDEAHYLPDDMMGHSDMMATSGIMRSGMMGNGFMRNAAMKSAMKRGNTTSTPMKNARIKGSTRIANDLALPASRATVEYIDGGARLVFRPKNSIRLKALRERAWLRAGWLASGACPAVAPAQPINRAPARPTHATRSVTNPQSAG